MPRFTVRVTRRYILEEAGQVEIESDTAADALAQAKAGETDGELDPCWIEDDGCADIDSYEWTIVGPDGAVVALTGTGTDDNR